MAVGTAISIVQVALSSKLSGDSTLMALVSIIRDQASVAQNQVFPYITIGDIVETQDDTLSTRQYDQDCTLHIWTQSSGFKQAQGILARCNVLLHRQPLTLSGSQTHVATWYRDAIPLADPDGITQHLVVHYRLIVEEAI